MVVRPACGLDTVIVGLISDTHGLLRAEAIAALRGSDVILHAGDVGKPEILVELRKTAILHAVRGNIDIGDWAERLPETLAIEAGPAKIYMLHDLHQLDPDSAAGYHIVVSGHSHKPVQREEGGVLYINPGSAGPRRFKLPITVARLDLGRKPWALDFIDLAGGGRQKA